MSFPLQNGPTFILRKICQKIQAKMMQILISPNINQLQSHFTEQIQQTKQKQMIKSHFQKYANNQDIMSKHSQSIVQAVKNDLIRIVSCQLPQVVSYQSKINDRLEYFQQQISECKIQIKMQKQNNRASVLEKDRLKLQILEVEHQNKQLNEELERMRYKYDRLKVQILEVEHQNKQLNEELERMRYKYDEAITLVDKYMRQIQKLQVQKESIQVQKIQLYSLLQQRQSRQVLKQVTPIMTYMASPKSLSLPKQTNLPLQLKKQGNQVEKVFSRSPRSKGLPLESQSCHLSSEIIDYQKQLLLIQVRESQKQIVQLRSGLERCSICVNNSQNKVFNLQKLLDGEKRLNEKLDRQLYILITTTKEMKIQLLQQKARAKQLQDQMLKLEQNVSALNNMQMQLQAKITQLQAGSKKLDRLQQQKDQLKSQLQISQKKYEQLRKIKQQLQQSVEQFQTKLSQLQIKQSGQQLLTRQFRQAIKTQNCQKVRQIQEMSLTIKAKYQKKIQIIQKQCKQLKQSYKLLKQDNNRLYDGMQIQAKKQMQIQQKYKKIKQRLSRAQREGISILKSKQLSDERLRSSSLVNKQLNIKVLLSEKGKQQLYKKLKMLQMSSLPRLISQIARLNDQLFRVKSSVYKFKQLNGKCIGKFQNQFQSKLEGLFNQEKQKFGQLQKDYNKKLTLLQHFKQQSEERQGQTVRLVQRLNCLEKQRGTTQEHLQRKNQEIKSVQDNRKEIINNLQQQIEKYREIQKRGLEQAEILREKQKQVDKFAGIIQNLTHQNQNLKKELSKYPQRQRQAPFDVGSKNQISTTSYLLPNKLQIKQPGMTNNHDSRSCVHFRLPLNNRNSFSAIQLLKNQNAQTKPLSQSLQKKRAYMQNYKQRPQNEPSFVISSNQFPAHSLPVLYNSRSHFNRINEQIEYGSEQRQDNDQQKVKSEFENQKQRLQEIKQEYQRMMADKFRQGLVDKRQGNKDIY